MNGVNGDCPPPEDSNVEQANNTDDHPTGEQLIAGKLADERPADERPAERAPASCVLIVSNLVRPFTLTGLKKVLSKCGRIADDKFWINKDKSKCYVLYEDEQIAQQSSEYINSLKWPASNPNTLESAFGSLDELNELIKRDEEERVQLEKERKEAAALEAAKQEERKQQLKEEMSKKFADSLIDPSAAIELNGDAANKLNRSASKEETADEQLENSAREPSPAKNPPTNVLHVTNLVRPFTLNQLKELLKRFGAIIEEKFWIDRIKSRCYVVYESVDDAVTARHQLHGLKWPRTNTKTLRADFGKLSDVNDVISCDLDKLKIKEDKSATNNDKQPATNNREASTNDRSKEEKSGENNSQANKSVDESKEPAKERLRKISPPKHPASNIILIKNLARPFTQTQLKELLSADGSYDEERFWIDRLKSMCYACYESEEVATKTRERLHQLNWPVGNQKKLFVDFATETDLENRLNGLNPNRLKAVDTQQQQQAAVEEPVGKKQRKQRLDDGHENELHMAAGIEEPLDLDKEHDLSSNKRRRETSASPARNKRDHRAESPLAKEYGHKDGNHVRPSPGKTLDDLFRKTKTVPSIYWMPLSEEAIRQRDEQREAEQIRFEAKLKRPRGGKGRRSRMREAERFRRESPPFNHQYNGRQRSPPPRREPPIGYSRAPFRDFPPEREHDRFMAEKRAPPPFRSDRPDRERMERDRTDRSMERILKRMARSPPAARSPPRTPEHRLQERGRRRTPEERKLEKRRTRSRSASSTGSTASSGSSSSYYRSRSRSVSKTRNKRQSHSRSRSPKRMVRSPRSPRSPRMADRDGRRVPARR